MASDPPVLRLGAYEGPLDLLLELARAQRVDLTRISILALAEQFVAAVEAATAGRRVPLSALGDWLVAAAALLALRALLLLPAGTPEHREAEREAAALRRRLADREGGAGAGGLARAAAAVRAGGLREGGAGGGDPGPPVADVTELLRACLRLLDPPARERVHRPSPPPLWHVPDALARIRALLAVLTADGAPLGRFVPRGGERARTPLQRRAALASTFVASLELGREGELALEQNEAFGDIAVRCVMRSATPGALAPAHVETPSDHPLPADSDAAPPALPSAPLPRTG
jgi:segregation and condensation protein A